VEALHQQFGACVRISPEEVSVSDVDAVKEIHRIGSGYLKAAWYSKFTQEKFASQEDLGIFAMQDPKVHSVRRRLFSAAFSKNSLSACEGIVHSKMVAAISGLQSELKANKSADLLAWLTFMVRSTCKATDSILNVLYCSGQRCHLDTRFRHFAWESGERKGKVPALSGNPELRNASPENAIHKGSRDGDAHQWHKC
jgi:hypothetical protein